MKNGLIWDILIHKDDNELTVGDQFKKKKQEERFNWFVVEQKHKHFKSLDWETTRNLNSDPDWDLFEQIKNYNFIGIRKF